MMSFLGVIMLVSSYMATDRIGGHERHDTTKPKIEQKRTEKSNKKPSTTNRPSTTDRKEIKTVSNIRDTKKAEEATVTIQLGLPSSDKSAFEPNSSSKSDAIEKLYLYVFDNSKKLEKIIVVNNMNSMNSMKSMQHVKVDVPTGQKYFLASLNMPILAGRSEINPQHIGVLTLGEALDSRFVNDQTLAGGDRQKMQMTGLSRGNIIGKSELVPLSLTRNYAKVDVKLGSGLLKNSPLGMKSATFSYTVHNVPKSSYSTNCIDKFNDDNTADTEKRMMLDATYLPLFGEPHNISFDWEDSGMCLIPENLLYLKNNDIELSRITYLLLEVTAQPTRVYNEMGASSAVIPSQDLYVSYKGRDRYAKTLGYMSDDADGNIKWYSSKEAAMKDGGTPICYKGGKMYYRINISNATAQNLADKYSIARNVSYRIPITSLAGLGVSDPKEVDGEPGQTISNKSNLKSLIDIKDWDCVYVKEYSLE